MDEEEGGGRRRWRKRKRKVDHLFARCNSMDLSFLSCRAENLQELTHDHEKLKSSLKHRDEKISALILTNKTMETQIHELEIQLVTGIAYINIINGWRRNLPRTV